MNETTRQAIELALAQAQATVASLNVRSLQLNNELASIASQEILVQAEITAYEESLAEPE